MMMTRDQYRTNRYVSRYEKPCNLITFTACYGSHKIRQRRLSITPEILPFNVAMAVSDPRQKISKAL